MAEILLRGGLVLCHAQHEPERLDIYIKNGCIEAIAPKLDNIDPSVTVFEAHDYLIHPGLINAHTHGHGALTKGVADRWNLEQLIASGGVTSTIKKNEYLALNAQLNAAEMLLKGCTAAFDMYSQLPIPNADGLSAIAQAYDQSGLRVVVAPMFADQNLYQQIPQLFDLLSTEQKQRYASGSSPKFDQILEQIKPVLSTHYDKVSWAIGPSIPLVSSDEFMIACHHLAQELNLLIHTHAIESAVQRDSYPLRYEQGLFQHLADLGILDNRWVLAHCVWLEDKDRQLIAKHGAHIAHNPISNLRLGSGIAHLRAMLDQQITVGIGTDGATSSDNQNMYEAMRMAALLSRVKTTDVNQWVTAQEAFFAATEGSAACLGFKGQLGRIQEQYLADLVFIHLKHINWQPCNHVLQQLIYVEDATAVEHVMVHGEWVVLHKKLLKMNLQDLAMQAEIARQELAIHTNLNTDAHKKLLQVIASFCACGV